MFYRIFDHLGTALFVGVLALSLNDTIAQADDTTEIEAAETATEEASKGEHWREAVMAKYEISEEQYKSLQDQGLKGNQIAIVAGLAKESGKSLDEVAKMRTEDKMGWGKIAKEIGVHPSTIGHSVSALRKEVKSNRHEAKQERKRERRQARAEKREARRAARTERRGKGPRK
ncbi:MAG: hypothetical protein H6624_12390 [Bdellovibrionaceae bacterium]|nr:hypothetical protein [Bdellovibrionales bacterium]MCB9085142.1 hypothetical protein [Pseudobdellovibrionaceae bacterium]